MPDFNWNHLQTFLAVARSGRLTLAALKLSSDHTTLKRRITALEHGLDTKLFDRTPAGYLLTPEGQRLMPIAEQMERLALGAREGVGGATSSLAGVVRIGVPEGFGSFFLAPRISQLTETYPDLRVQLVAGPTLYSLAKREADVIVTLSRPVEGRLYARKLTDYQLGLYGSSSYLDNYEKIKDTSDLCRHKFIGYIEDLLLTPELDYLHQINPRISTMIESSNLIAQLSATIAGAGLCILPHFIARNESRLVAVLPDDIALMRSFWMVAHADLRDLARVKMAMTFLARQVRAAQLLFSSPD